MKIKKNWSGGAEPKFYGVDPALCLQSEVIATYCHNNFQFTAKILVKRSNQIFVKAVTAKRSMRATSFYLNGKKARM